MPTLHPSDLMPTSIYLIDRRVFTALIFLFSLDASLLKQQWGLVKYQENTELPQQHLSPERKTSVTLLFKKDMDRGLERAQRKTTKITEGLGSLTIEERLRAGFAQPREKKSQGRLYQYVSVFKR